MPTKSLLALAILAAPATVLHALDLPPEVAQARETVMRIAADNTTRTDNIPEIRTQLDPHLEVLADWFAAHRPANEVELTQKPWKNVWYDDPDIDVQSNLDLGFLQFTQDRTSIYQVVREGYYYNVSEWTLTLYGIPFPVQNFLKGAYQIKDPAGPSNIGQAPLNIVDLEFVANSIRLGRLPAGFALDPLVVLVDLNWIPTIPVPGPIGVTGQLWNLYIDNEVRIAAGFDEAEPDVLDVYVLRKADTVERNPAP